MLKWIHRRCAYGTDGLVRPKEYAREVEICYRCGEGLENSVRGPLYLYEVGEEVESIPSEHIVYTAEGEKIALTDDGGHISLEKLHAEIEDESIPVLDMREDLPMGVIVEDEVQSEDVAIPAEMVPAAEPPTDGAPRIEGLDPEGKDIGKELPHDTEKWGTADKPLENITDATAEENVTATLEDQIAALRAKIDAYEAEKE